MQRVCMTFILLAASWSDMRCNKIPNELIMTGWAMSLALAGWQQGLGGLPRSIAGILAVMAAGFPLYWCRAIGAGDIKLLSVLAGIHGLRRSVQVFMAGILLAATVGVFLLVSSVFGIERWTPVPLKRILCVREEVNGEQEGERHRLGRHHLILAPFLTLAYVLV